MALERRKWKEETEVQKDERERRRGIKRSFLHLFHSLHRRLGRAPS